MRRQLRALYEMVFGRPKADPGTRTYLQMLSGHSPVFSARAAEAYDYDVVRSAVDAIARNAAKLKPKHIRRKGDDVQYARSGIERLLSFQPNPFMDAYSFYYKIVTQLLMRNNAFVYPHRDRMTGVVLAFYPVMSSTVELLEGPDGLMYCRFRFGGGQQVTMPYEELIHLRRFFYRHDIFGDNNQALTPTLDLIRTTDEGIANAVKSSAHIRGILKFTAMLKPEDMEAQKNKFVEDYLSINNYGGVAATDAKAEYEPLENKPVVIDAKQMEAIKDKVYSYFGINDAIIKSRYKEHEWNAFYESMLEPLAVQMSLAFTNALFTPREAGHGNEILFEANRLQYASIGSKINVVTTLVDRGMMSLNQGLEVFNLPRVPDGDKRIMSLNFVDADKANLYQVGVDDDGANDEAEEDED